MAKRHYGVHEGKPFFEGLVEFITSGPIIALGLPAVVQVTGKNEATIGFLFGQDLHSPDLLVGPSLQNSHLREHPYQ